MKTRRATRLIPAALCLVTSALLLPAADWPQLLGPNRDGIYTGKDLAAAWPKGGPRVVWQKKIGQGFAAPVVAQGKLILFTRVGDAETVEALDAKDGKPLWKFEYPASYKDDFGFDPGPRATPTVVGTMVYTFGADSYLHCLDLRDGNKIWRLHCGGTFQAKKGFFGFACSPLVSDDQVFLNVGGRGASVVSIDRYTGKPANQAFDDEASYSSPQRIVVGGTEYAAVLTRGQLLIIQPGSHHMLGAYPFKPPVHASVTGATPLVVSNQIFITAAYDLGAALLRLNYKMVERGFEPGGPKQRQPSEGELSVIWANDTSLSCQFTTPVHRDGFLYGLHGRHDIGGTELRCVEMATGKVRWSKAGLAGANVLLAGDSLLVLTENGELIRAAASPDGYRETARAQILGRGVRAHPALADGLFYARDKGQVVCVDLR